MTIGALALLAAQPGCDGDETGAGGSGGAGPGGPTVRGLLQYEKPGRLPTGGLDHSRVTTHPIRGARVVAVDVVSGARLGSAVSGEDGTYSIPLPISATVKVWVYSETAEPSITVEDNTSGDAVYVLETAAIEAAGDVTVDVLARTGWDGEALAQPRTAGPFAVLDAAYAAARRFRVEVAPPPVFPPLRINWSVNNSPEDGDVTRGQTGFSYWDGEEIYVLGREGADADEFDDHVIVHEWGHYFESVLGRSDSFGGAHSYGDVLDPRLALSEGWGNALSAMILDPDTVYADSYGAAQADGFAYDLEASDVSPDAASGWFSEATAGQTWFDLYDPANEDWDGVALGLPGIFALMTEDLKVTPALTTLFPLVVAARSRFPGSAAAIDALVEWQKLSPNYGIDPIVDDWGTGETHSGHVDGALPVYLDIAPGETVSLELAGGQDSALLVSNRYFRVIGEGKTTKVTSTAATDIDLYVFDRGELLAFTASASGNESVSWGAASGKSYVVVVVAAEIEPISSLTDITRAP